MRLERIANGAPRFVIHIGQIRAQSQYNETFVLSESARNCKNLPVAKRTVTGKVWTEAFQTAVSAQPIREKKSVKMERINPRRALIAS
jgi:hypothetical protein